jgi:nitrite reductase/ring-hydroxylating ferredoxin subunit/uncharacterized membrane protein
VPTPIESLMRRIEEFKALDGLGEQLGDAVAAATRSRPVKNALSGTWLGHRLHPSLVPLPIGMWGGAALLDLVGTRSARSGADALVGAGVVAALPTAAAGLSDWSDTFGGARRVGLVHATANTVALACYTGSLVARLLGRRRPGVALALVGAAAVTAGGYLGGHLAYVQGVGVERKAFEDGPTEWTPALGADELAEGVPAAVRAGDTTVMLYREGGTVHALAEHCNHEGGPLHEGSFRDGCVTCPWHGSTFRLRDGRVVRGPATSSQPVYATRTVDGKLEVRRVS